MEGQGPREGVAPTSTLWPLLVIAGTGILLLGVLARGRRWFRGTRRVPEAFWCPFREREAGVEFEITAWDGRRVDVSRCTLFTPPTAVTCEKRCLDVRNAG